MAVEVLYVFDGDSIEVALPDGESTEVRLIGINAPEGDECHGDASRQALEAMLTDANVTLATDDDESDQFGRLLRYVYAGNRNVNLALVESGAALALQTGHSLEPGFVAATDTAAADQRGMWSPDACGPQEPPPAATISDYVFDPPGSDTDHPNDEWVEIIVESGTTDMSEWILRDESTQHRFEFPRGFSLGMGQSVTVHSGCGSDTTRDLFWCAGDPVWSNGGDTIILQSPTGSVVARERFPGEY